MKKVFAGILALGSLAFAGCGPTADDLVGTWTYAEGSALTTDCGDLGVSSADYSGISFTLAAGASHDLIDVGESECVGAYSFEGGELRADGTEGTCETVEDDGSTTVEGEIYWVYSVEGETATLTPTGEIKVTISIEGMDPYTCTGSFDAGSMATK